MSISIALERVRRCVRLPQKLWRFPAATRQLRSLLASPVAQMPRLAKIDSCPRWTPHRIAKRRIDKAARRDDGRTAIESRRQFWRAPLATLVPQCSTRAVQRRLLHVPLSFGANASCSRQRGVFLPSSMDIGYGYRLRGHVSSRPPGRSAAGSASRKMICGTRHGPRVSIFSPFKIIGRCNLFFRQTEMRRRPGPPRGGAPSGSIVPAAP